MSAIIDAIDNSGNFESEEAYTAALNACPEWDGALSAAIRRKAVRSGFITIPTGHTPGRFPTEPTVQPERLSWSFQPGRFPGQDPHIPKGDKQ